MSALDCSCLNSCSVRLVAASSLLKSSTSVEEEETDAAGTEMLVGRLLAETETEVLAEGLLAETETGVA